MTAAVVVVAIIESKSCHCNEKIHNYMIIHENLLSFMC